MEAVIVKVQPWTGFNGEVFEGVKTKVSLFQDRLEYCFKYTEKVKVDMINSQDGPSEQDMFTEEEGVIGKDCITSITKYVDTTYNPENLSPYKLHKVEVSFAGSMVTFDCSEEDEKIKLYKEIYNWKYKNGKQ